MLILCSVYCELNCGKQRPWFLFRNGFWNLYLPPYAPSISQTYTLASVPISLVVDFSNGNAQKKTRHFSPMALPTLGMGKRNIEPHIREESQFLLEELKKTNGKWRFIVWFYILVYEWLYESYFSHPIQSIFSNERSWIWVLC